MDMKNRLTDKLLKVAKKHRILTYPVLALIALISVISYFFNWSTGAGKRVVAVVMVMVLLVSQSCFLTSSATEVTDETYVSQSEDEAMPSSEEIAADTTGGEESGTDESVPSIDPVETVTDDATGEDMIPEENFENQDDSADIPDVQAASAVELKVIFDYVDYNGQNAYPEISVTNIPVYIWMQIVLWLFLILWISPLHIL